MFFAVFCFSCNVHNSRNYRGRIMVFMTHWLTLYYSAVEAHRSRPADVPLTETSCIRRRLGRIRHLNPNFSYHINQRLQFASEIASIRRIILASHVVANTIIQDWGLCICRAYVDIPAGISQRIKQLSRVLKCFAIARIALHGGDPAPCTFF
jgi:hypothetical protein